jgi:hypothetical protein
VKEDLLQMLDDVLKPSGFKLSGNVWRRTNMETIDVVGLQKSAFSDSFYINLGVFFPFLKSLTNPLPKQCHIQVRFDAVHPDPEMLEPILSGGERSIESTGVLKWGFTEADKVFFGRFKTLKSACQFLAEHPESGFAIEAALYHHWKQINGDK